MDSVSWLLNKIEKDIQKNDVTLDLENVKHNLIVVLWDTNSIYLLQDNEVKFISKCVTWRKWFGNEKWSYKTPLWWHKIVWYYWDELETTTIFKWRIPIWNIEYYPSYPNIYPVIISRILQLKWLENRNNNTYERYIYIHWTPNTWYWDKYEFKKSYWCISLKPNDVIKLFDLVNWKETFIYIMN